MRIAKLTLLAGVAAVSLTLASPAFAQLTEGEAQLKTQLEHKAQQAPLTPDEVQLYKSLLDKEEHETPFNDHAQQTAGDVIGGGGAIIAVGVGALFLCTLGILPACPLIAAAGG
jgi:hypothetical protein